MAKKEKDEKPKVEMKQYTDAELQKFHGLVQKYYYDYTLETGKDAGQVIRMLDKKKLMVAYGAINERGAVSKMDLEVPPSRLVQFENIYEQWQYWKVKTGLEPNLGERKKLEQLDEVAQQMTVDPGPEEIPF
jgi:hypothetical protein